MNGENKNNLSDILLDKIKKGEIKMRPKIYFVAKLILLALATAIITFFAIFVASFIFFIIRASGLMFLPSFGFLGIKLLLLSLPWVLILGLLVLVATSEIFIKHFPFVYKNPILYSLLAIVIVILIGGLLIDNSGFHTNMLLKARDGKLPVAGPLYQKYGIPESKQIHYGIVSELSDSGFKIETPRKEEVFIHFSEKTRIPKEGIKENDAVIILGEKTNGEIKAYEIKKVNRDFNIFPGKPPAMKYKNLPSA
jgi:hypothetical protein